MNSSVAQSTKNNNMSGSSNVNNSNGGGGGGGGTHKVYNPTRINNYNHSADSLLSFQPIHSPNSGVGNSGGGGNSNALGHSYNIPQPPVSSTTKRHNTNSPLINVSSTQSNTKQNQNTGTPKHQSANSNSNKQYSIFNEVLTPTIIHTSSSNNSLSSMNTTNTSGNSIFGENDPLSFLNETNLFPTTPHHIYSNQPQLQQQQFHSFNFPTQYPQYNINLNSIDNISNSSNTTGNLKSSTSSGFSLKHSTDSLSPPPPPQQNPTTTTTTTTSSVTNITPLTGTPDSPSHSPALSPGQTQTQNNNSGNNIPTIVLPTRSPSSRSRPLSEPVPQAPALFTSTGANRNINLNNNNFNFNSSVNLTGTNNNNSNTLTPGSNTELMLSSSSSSTTSSPIKEESPPSLSPNYNNPNNNINSSNSSISKPQNNNNIPISPKLKSPTPSTPSTSPSTQSPIHPPQPPPPPPPVSPPVNNVPQKESSNWLGMGLKFLKNKILSNAPDNQAPKWDLRKSNSHFLNIEDRTRCSYRQTTSGKGIAKATITLSSPFNYFEIFITNGTGGKMCIGLCTSDHALDVYPGFLPNSYGYSGDGKLYCGNGEAKSYGTGYGSGDVVGCGIDSNKSLYFTKNGQLIGIAAQKVKNAHLLYPTVGLQSPGESVVINFYAPFNYNPKGSHTPVGGTNLIPELEICKWSSKCGKNVRVSECRASIPSEGNQAIGGVQSTQPFSDSFCYFEVYIESLNKGNVSVGLASKEYPINLHIGWVKRSYAYHSDDGRKFKWKENSLLNEGESYGVPFGQGDTIGCGFLSDRKIIFFTKNGVFQGIAFENVYGILYPSVAFNEPGNIITGIFAPPFRFQISHVINAVTRSTPPSTLLLPPNVGNQPITGNSQILSSSNQQVNNQTQTTTSNNTSSNSVGSSGSVGNSNPSNSSSNIPNTTPINTSANFDHDFKTSTSSLQHTGSLPPLISQTPINTSSGSASGVICSSGNGERISPPNSFPPGNGSVTSSSGTIPPPKPAYQKPISLPISNTYGGNNTSPPGASPDHSPRGKISTSDDLDMIHTMHDSDGKPPSTWRRCGKSIKLKDEITLTMIRKKTSMAQADRPFSTKMTHGYFEVFIEGRDKKGEITVGLTHSQYPFNKHIGREYKSYGYSSTGDKWCGNLEGEPYGDPFFVDGDCIIGCGINNNTHEIFFTLNGIYLGVAFYKVPSIPLYPSISYKGVVGSTTIATFNNHFRFDLDSLPGISPSVWSESLGFDKNNRGFLGWPRNDVGIWLEVIGYGKYKKSFRDNNISGRHLHLITHDLLKGDLGIAPLGPRADILDRVNKILEIWKDRVGADNFSSKISDSSESIESLDSEKRPSDEFQEDSNNYKKQRPNQHYKSLENRVRGSTISGSTEVQNPMSVGSKENKFRTIDINDLQNHQNTDSFELEPMKKPNANNTFPFSPPTHPPSSMKNSTHDLPPLLPAGGGNFPSIHPSFLGPNEINTSQVTTTKAISSENITPMIHTWESPIWEIEYNDLEFGALIGKGFFGEVKKGRWRETDVAIKIIYRDSFKTKSSIEMFKNEVSILSKLRHPNIVQFMGACTTGKSENHCIVTEWMGGGSLRQFLVDYFYILEQNPLLRLKIALDMAIGMTYLHGWIPPILHRDLSSRNILLDHTIDPNNPSREYKYTDFKSKISDFGLSKLKMEQNSMTSSVGCIPYMAPEVFQGSANSEKSDVYSYGMVLWELLTSEEPQLDMNPMKMAHLAANENYRPPIPVTTPAKWKEIITLCWDKHPENRPTFKQIVSHLRGMELQGVSSLAPQPPPTIDAGVYG